MPRAAILFLLTASVAAGACSRPAAPPPPPTFDKDVAPIVFTNCAPCHRPGQAAPFSLLSYADVRKHIDGVVDQTRKRHMPPWLPDPGEFPIVGERRLTADQIDTLQRWAATGMAEGRAADLPALPSWPDGWQLGRPDMVLTPPRPFELQPRAEDTYRNLVMRMTLPSDVFVRAVEFRTGGAPIHHAVIRVDTTGAARRRDGADGRPGFDGMSMSALDPEGQFVGWAPGRGPIESPEGMAWRLERGSDLVVEVHVLGSKKPIVIQPSVGLYFTKTPPVHQPIMVKMGSKLIDIPAGQRDYVITDSYELPVDVQLLSVYPHAHYLGKDMLITATLPGGAVKTLLHIPHWSFHWQPDYRYATPIALPKGTTIAMKYTYDNSTDNEDNPHNPPVRVRLGPQSTDEMAELSLQLLAASSADRDTLARAFEDRDVQANIALGEMQVRENPASAEAQALLGSSYVEAGRYDEALPHLEAAVKIDGTLAGAQNDLGTALMQQGKLAEAMDHFRRAAALSPRDADTFLFNLGNALAKASRVDEAVTAYTRAIAVNPEFPDAQVNLGSLLFSRGRFAEALTHFERAAALQPDSAVIETNVGNALAAMGRYREATQHVQHALTIDPDNAAAAETMRRLQQVIGGR